MPNQSEIQTVAIAATFTAEPVAVSINFWMQELGIPSRVAFASYNQVFQELLDPASLLSRNDNGVNVLFIRLADWLGSPGRSSSSRELKCNNAIEVRRTARQLLKLYASSYNALQCLCWWCFVRTQTRPLWERNLSLP
jgi:hypothetical protein